RLMEEWLEWARGVGLTPEAVLPAPLLLPWEPGSWSVVITPERGCWVRSGEHAGWGVDEENLLFALKRALSDPEWQPPERLVVWRGAEAEKPDAAIEGLGIPVEWRHHHGDPLTLLAAHDRPGRGIDLAQGRFARSGQMDGVWRTLRPTAVLLLIWLLMRGGETGIEAWRLAERAEGLDRAIEAEKK
ncbi:MAG: hypothetical protein HQM00_14475, partial [Magnetococcales bacterium]|nr:hypothetical protein [Magnetococcales bacterium]